jgi:eukaryotic-like serine/threonine-protein kinase
VEKIGKYEIVDKIGVGGFGVVFKGLDPFIKRHVAIKTCSTEDRETRDRFLREAEIAGNLQHRNIVTVFEFGFHGDIPYLVQEFLTGEDLDHKIRRRDALSIVQRVAWLVEIARGLEFAHTAGVVHRDIKPANVRVLADGHAKILDFGIAKLAQQQSTLTQAGVTLGTAAYLAPEQIRGEAVDSRTDVFAFGVLAYELLTYERPFRAQEISALFYKLLNEQPAPILQLAPGTPPDLARIVERCLEKDPAKRFAPTIELVKALEKLERRLAAEARTGTPGLDRTTTIELEERTTALQAARAVEAAPAAAQRTVNPVDRTLALGDVELESPRSGARAESYGMATARLSPAARRVSRFVASGAVAAALVGGIVFVAMDRQQERAPASAESQDAPSPAAALAGDGADREGAPDVDSPSFAEPRAEAAIEPAGEAAETAASPPSPPPVETPKPGKIVVGPAWDPAMTVAIGGRRYPLDRERTIEHAPGVVAMSFRIESAAYRFEQDLRLQLREGATERVSIPIDRPGRLTVQPHLNTRPGTVRVDGEVAGATPVRGRWLAPGEHFVEVFPVGAVDGEPPVAMSVTIRSDVETILTVDLDGRLEPLERERPIGGP